MEKSAPELRFGGDFLPVSVAVTVLKTLTGQLRADISATKPRTKTAWPKLSSSAMVLSAPPAHFAPGYGAQAVWSHSFQKP